jgi:hypothetical protein
VLGITPLVNLTVHAIARTAYAFISRPIPNQMLFVDIGHYAASADFVRQLPPLQKNNAKSARGMWLHPAMG